MTSSKTNARVIPAANNASPKQGYRELFLPSVEDDEEQPFYMVVLEPGSLTTKKSIYRIPMGKVHSLTKGKAKSGQNVIVPIIPEVETIEEIETDKSTQIKHGYIYVFRNRKFWRELKVVSPGQFSDINLRVHQGKDKRPASGDKDRHLLLPYKIDGEEYKIHIAYSTVQWGWRYICALGGMDDKNDDRYREKLHSGKKYGKDHHSVTKLSTDDFDQRLQKLDLSIWKDSDVTIDADDRQPRMQKIKPGDKLYFRKIHQNSDLNVVTLADPVGEALSLSVLYKSLRVKMQAIHDSIKNTVVDENGKVIKNPTPVQINKQLALFQTASFLTSYIYHEDKDEKSSLKESVMKKFLHSDEIIKLVEEIDEIKNKLIDHIEDYTSPFNMTVVMKDMFALEDWRYLKAWDTIANVLNMISGSSASQVEHLILDSKKIKEWRNKDRSEDLLLSLSGMHPKGKQHPLSLYLFPDEVYKDSKNTNDYVNPLFNHEKMQAMVTGSSSESSQKWSKTIAVSIDLFLKEFIKLPNLIEENNTNAANSATKHKANMAQLKTTNKKLSNINSQQNQLNAQLNNSKADQKLYEKRIVDASLSQNEQQQARTDLNNTKGKQAGYERQITRNGQVQIELVIQQQKQLSAATQTGPIHAKFAHVKGNYLTPFIQLMDSIGLLKNVKKVSISISELYSNGMLNTRYALIADVLVDNAKLDNKITALRNELESNQKKLPLYDANGKYLTHINSNTLLDQDVNLKPVLDTINKARIAANGGNASKIDAYIYLLDDIKKDIESKTNALAENDSQLKKETSFKDQLKAEIKATKQQQAQQREARKKFKSRIAGPTMVTSSIMLAGLDVWNLIETIRKFNAEKLKTVVDLSGAVVSVIASLLSVAETVSKLDATKLTKFQEATVHNAVKNNIAIEKVAPELRPHVKKAVFARKVLGWNTAAGVFALGLSIWDVMLSLEKDDEIAAYGHGLGATSALLAIAGGIFSVGTLGVGAIIIGIISFAVLLWSDTKLETWLTNCYFGTAPGGGKFQKMLDQPEHAYLELMNQLQGPSVEIKNTRQVTGAQVSLPTLEVIINTPGYTVGKSELVREFSYYDYETKQWHRFDKAAGTKASTGKSVDIQKIWDHATVYLLKGRSGYKIQFPVYCCFEQLRLSNGGGAADIQVKVQVHPNGKNKPAFNGGQLAYVMPIKNSIEQPKAPPATTPSSNTPQPVKDTASIPIAGWATAGGGIPIAKRNIAMNTRYHELFVPRCKQITDSIKSQKDKVTF